MTTTAINTRFDAGIRTGRGMRKGSYAPLSGVNASQALRYTVTPAAIASAAVCAGQAAAAAGNLTINGTLASGGVATLDCVRAVSIYAPGTETAVNFTIYGTDVVDNVLVWSTAGPAAGEFTTSAKTFKTVTRVAVDTATTSSVTVGSADTFGFPVRVAKRSDVDLFWAGSLITSNSGFTASDASTPTATTGDVRGKLAVQSAADAAKVLDMRIWCADIDTSDGIDGKDQYDG